MWSSPILNRAALSVLSLAALLTSQEPGEESPEIVRLREQQQAQYRQLLTALAKSAIDMRRDGLRALVQKHKAIDKAVHEFADETVATMLDPFAIGIDYVRFVEATSPRLTGRVLRIGASRGQKNLTTA